MHNAHLEDILARFQNSYVRVPTIDLAELLTTVEAALSHTRARRNAGASSSRLGRRGGAIVMKLDVEHAEERILPNLLARGVACLPDHMFVEWHVESAAELAIKRSVDQRYKALWAAGTCGTRISEDDDEAFAWDTKPLPQTSMCSDGGARGGTRRPRSAVRDIPSAFGRYGGLWYVSQRRQQHAG